MRCHYIIPSLREKFSSLTKEQVLEKARCPNDAVPGYTRCKKHGGDDITVFFTRDMKEDQKIRYRDVFDNIMETYRIAPSNLFVKNLIAMLCRSIVLSHTSDPNEIQHYLHEILQVSRELAITPRETKRGKIDVNLPGEEAAKKIESTVKERLALEGKSE